jgi:sensor histidine kinase YesM
MLKRIAQPKLWARRSQWPKLTVFLAFWSLVGLSFASQSYLANSHSGFFRTWNQSLVNYLADWYLFALLSIPVLKLSRRFQFEKSRWGWITSLHLVFSFLFSCIYILLRAWVGQFQALWFGNFLEFPQALQLLSKTFLYNVWIYWVILAVSHAFSYYQKLHERELRASELESRLAQARLHALQCQLNPHFLFNTLHSISSLVHKDADAADRMIMKLSDLLRLALDNTAVHEVQLSEEVDFLQRYLEIEQTRFRDRLVVQMDFQSNTLQAKVPNLVLQPLVENAIRHGIEKHARPGKIILRSIRHENHLALEVQDNGDGISDKKPTREGIGLANTRNRLSQLYGSSQSFILENAPEGGLLARIILPFRTDPI